MSLKAINRHFVLSSLNPNRWKNISEIRTEIRRREDQDIPVGVIHLELHRLVKDGVAQKRCRDLTAEEKKKSLYEKKSEWRLSNPGEIKKATPKHEEIMRRFGTP